MRVQDDLSIRSVGHRRRPGRLGEVNHFRRDSHVHVMPAAHQLPADGDVGLDFARVPQFASTNFIADPGLSLPVRILRNESGGPAPRLSRPAA